MPTYLQAIELSLVRHAHLALLLFAGLAPGSPVLAAERGHFTIIRPDTPVEAGGPELPLTEPHAAVNPSDPDHIAVGAIVAPTSADSPWRCAVFVSWDSGRSWLRHDFALDGGIDPWVLFDRSGALLFAAIEIGLQQEAGERFRLLVFRSEDGGRTWPAEPGLLGTGHDHPVLTLAPVPSPPGSVAGKAGAIYLASRRSREPEEGYPRHTVFLARSEDGGRTFQKAAETLPSNLALNVTGIAALSSGDLVVSFFDFQRNVDGFDRQGMLTKARAWLTAASQPPGALSEPRFITDECASGIEGVFPGYPFLAVDTSNGPYRDRLYHASVRPGLEGVVVTYSNDGGRKWSEPVRVGGPPGQDRSHALTAMLTVNRQGVVGVGWYDRGNDPDRRCQDFYFTASTNGGKSFLSPVRISTVSSCPETEANGRAGKSWPGGGDYSSITAGPDGVFRLFWADSRSGLYKLRQAAVEVKKAILESQP